MKKYVSRAHSGFKSDRIKHAFLTEEQKIGEVLNDRAQAQLVS